MELTKRQQEIIEYIEPRHFASVSEIAKSVYTSGATVRRELQRLENMGIVKSVYGGVVLSEYHKEPVPIYIRDSSNSADKEKIAFEASKLVRDNATVIFDSSSTVRRICKHIKERQGLTVITNNLRVCEELKDSNIKVVCTGGTLIPKRECFVGHFAEDFILKVKADMLFFSSQGLSSDGMITDSSEEEIALRKAMISVSKETYFLCDSSKLGKDFPFVLCNGKDVTKTLLNK